MTVYALDSKNGWKLEIIFANVGVGYCWTRYSDFNVMENSNWDFMESISKIIYMSYIYIHFNKLVLEYKKKSCGRAEVIHVSLKKDKLIYV